MSRRRLVGLALLALAAGGCASLRQALEPPAEAPAPALNGGVPTADQLAAPHRALAAQREREGALRPAVEAWVTALALAPDHEPSRAALKRLRARVDREVAEHLQRGWHAIGREGPEAGRRHFLAALALDPDSRPAQEALRATAPVAPSPAARPAAPPPAEGRGEAARPGAGTAAVKVVPAPPEPRRAGGEESEKPAVLYFAARAHLAEGRDEDAYRALARLARVSPGYADSARLLRELRPRLVRQRYQDGLRLFREEQIEEAIARWRGVLELDPEHAHARRHIEQAEKMLRTLAAQPKR